MQSPTSGQHMAWVCVLDKSLSARLFAELQQEEQGRFNQAATATSLALLAGCKQHYFACTAALSSTIW